MSGKKGDALAWALIGILIVALLIGMAWANRQPKVHSIWGEASETRKGRRTRREIPEERTRPAAIRRP
jgi:hypothetical protein